MRVLLVHPSPLMYSELYLRLEPLGLERVASAIRTAGHEVRLLDLQIFQHADYWRELETFAPQAIGFSVNYLANVPEVVDLAKETRTRRPGVFILVGGHSASFVASEFLEHADGAIDCIVRGEGEVIAPRVLEAIGDPKLDTLPGVVTLRGQGPSPTLLDDLDLHLPARDLGRKRHKYFIGVLDPCASVEFTRGCPWDCSFCSAWTFYGRSYRKGSPEKAGEDLARIREPNVFIVDDVAFIHAEHGFARVLQSSSVTVEDGKQGVINSITRLPYQVVNGQGQPSTNFEETGIRTNVTPQIMGARSDSVKLALNFAVKSLLSYSDQGPLTASREIQTVLHVRSGQSAAVGGLITNDSGTPRSLLRTNTPPKSATPAATSRTMEPASGACTRPAAARRRRQPSSVTMSPTITTSATSQPTQSSRNVPARLRMASSLMFTVPVEPST